MVLPRTFLKTTSLSRGLRPAQGTVSFSGSTSCRWFTGERLSVLSAGRHTQSLGPQRPAYLGSLSASILIPVQASHLDSRLGEPGMRILHPDTSMGRTRLLPADTSCLGMLPSAPRAVQLAGSVSPELVPPL